MPIASPIGAVKAERNFVAYAHDGDASWVASRVERVAKNGPDTAPPSCRRGDNCPRRPCACNTSAALGMCSNRLRHLTMIPSRRNAVKWTVAREGIRGDIRDDAKCRGTASLMARVARLIRICRGRECSIRFRRASATCRHSERWREAGMPKPRGLFGPWRGESTESRSMLAWRHDSGGCPVYGEDRPYEVVDGQPFSCTEAARPSRPAHPSRRRPALRDLIHALRFWFGLDRRNGLFKAGSFCWSA